MNDEKPYLDPEFSIKKLAELSGMADYPFKNIVSMIPVEYKKQYNTLPDIIAGDKNAVCSA